MITMQPLWGNVLIRPISYEKTTKSGLVLPDSAQNKRVLKGVIITVGDGSLALDGSLIPMKVKAGDIVLFKKYEAEEVPFNNETLILLDQRQILTTVKEN